MSVLQETKESQLTYCFDFLSLMVDKFECQLDTDFKTKTFSKKIEAAFE